MANIKAAIYGFGLLEVEDDVLNFYVKMKKIKATKAMAYLQVDDHSYAGEALEDWFDGAEKAIEYIKSLKDVTYTAEQMINNHIIEMEAADFHHEAKLPGKIGKDRKDTYRFYVGRYGLGYTVEENGEDEKTHKIKYYILP